MGNHSDKFTKIFKDMHSEGFWFQNKNVKIGFSFAYVHIDGDDGILIDVDCDEDKCPIEIWEIHYNWEDFFNHLPDLRITLELNEGLDTKFYSWNEIKDLMVLKDKILKEQF